MAGLFQTGVSNLQIKSGSLLVAHPAHADRNIKNHVVMITESTKSSTMGLTLNMPNPNNLTDVLQDQGYDWPFDDRLYTGGYYNTRSMILLHSSEWSSTSTMQVAREWAVSSDSLMFKKLENYNAPIDFRLFVGCAGWQPHELAAELKGKSPQWLVVPNPSRRVIMADADDQWTLAVMECSHNAVDSWL
jgi:putative transcriptional regulator